MTYHVVRKLAGQWYQQSQHASEQEARQAAIEATIAANRDFTNDPYRFGLTEDGRLITEDAWGESLAGWSQLTDEQRAAEIAH